ncbi:hypothetical protein GGF31_000273 [Allomyces arbusculus]|nr:hypothetical protein GGF31_000273 [Allomyces arbusculus]
MLDEMLSTTKPLPPLPAPPPLPPRPTLTKLQGYTKATPRTDISATPPDIKRSIQARRISQLSELELPGRTTIRHRRRAIAATRHCCCYGCIPIRVGVLSLLTVAFVTTTAVLGFYVHERLESRSGLPLRRDPSSPHVVVDPNSGMQVPDIRPALQETVATIFGSLVGLLWILLLVGLIAAYQRRARIFGLFVVASGGVMLVVTWIPLLVRSNAWPTLVLTVVPELYILVMFWQYRTTMRAELDEKYEDL